jgi:hypothetical protein
MAKLQTLVDNAAALAATDAALAIISAYDGTNQIPTLADYTSAGVTGVTNANLNAVNSFVATASVSATATTAEVQAIVAATRSLAMLADGTANAGMALTANQLSTLGVTPFTSTAGGATAATKLGLFNSIVDGLPLTAVDSVAELNNIASIVDRILAVAAGQTVSPALTPSDFAAIGITGVDASNLSVVVSQLASTANNGSDVATFTLLSGVVNAAIADAAANPGLAVIIDYANNSANPAPTLATYTSLGIQNVSAADVVWVNQLIDAQVGVDVNTPAKVQALINAATAALAKIQAYAANPTTRLCRHWPITWPCR